MKIIATLFFCWFFTISYCQEFVAPAGYDMLKETTGDLDKDGTAEKVIVYNTTDSTDFGFVRELVILKQANGKWRLWKRSRNAILKSQEGGMMGDPFEDIEIRNGILIISCSGGSSWKWSYKDKYRFQNNQFQLIGHWSSAGKPCETWTEVDCNLQTGKINYQIDFEKCNNEPEIYKTERETFYKKGIHININNRIPDKIKIVTPKYKKEIYI